MSQSNPQQMRLFNVETVPWWGPAARYHVFKLLPIYRIHNSRRTYDLAWTPGHDLVSFRKVTARAFDNEIAGRGDMGTRRDQMRVARLDFREFQCLSREIQTPYGGIFIYVTQDICELKRTAEVMSERFSVGIVHAEDAYA